MNTEVTINGETGPGTIYVTWTPVPAQVRLAVANGAENPVPVTMRSRVATTGGRVVFGTTVATANNAQLAMTLPVDGTPVDFFVAGEFGRPSVEPDDAAVEVVDTTTSQVLSVTPLMVRIRKSAIALSDPERDRFLTALSDLNNQGTGRFAGFRLVHFEGGLDEAHFAQGFLPWHRAFLLDLERELQALDASIALPYWRFDQPAPRLFAQAFIGIPDPTTGAVRLSADNPLQFWRTDGVVGINRRPLFNTQTMAASDLVSFPRPDPVIDEAATIQLGDPGGIYANFAEMEWNPHGAAHMSFNGFLPNLDMAVRDPLFFLLHGNVDRLWAKWQWIKQRFDSTSLDTYSAPGHAGPGNPVRIGHNLEDTMWPWNEVSVDPRPLTAPGGDFPPSPLTSAPGLVPTVRSMIDYQGVHDPAARLGFDYDDVPFEV